MTVRRARLNLELDDPVDRWNEEDAIELQRPSDARSYRVNVTSRDWTVGTLIDQVRQGNIELDPAFQRRNAWRDARRSRLVESFILGFPVPQLVLAENPRSQGKFIVIDGKQRIMTLAGVFLTQFRDYWSEAKFTDLDILKRLNGVTLESLANSPEHADLRTPLQNADIRTTLITGFKSEDVLYDIFYRINTGSVPLSSQELRQVLNRGEFAQFLLRETGKPNPIWEVLRISSPDPRLRDVELLLRLIGLRMFSRLYVGNMKKFLDDTMKSLNATWVERTKDAERTTEDLFEAISAATVIFGDDLGRKLKGGKREKSFNRAVLEVQVYYFAFSKTRSKALRHRGEVRKAFSELFDDRDFVSSIESTTKSLTNYGERFSKAAAALSSAIGQSVQPLKIGGA